MTVLLAVIAAILAVPAMAVADDQSGENLNGQIRIPETVEGIDITVFQGDEEIGAVTTGSDGSWEVELPGPGDYRVVLDQESVPDEFVVDESPGAEIEVSVRPGQQRTVIFRLAPPGQEEAEASPSESADSGGGADAEADGGGEEGVTTAPGVSAGTPFGTKVVQLAVAGLIFGLIIAISAIGLSLIFGTTKMINFAHGDLVTFGAVMAMLFSTGAGGFGNSLLVLLVAGLLAAGAGSLLSGRAPRPVPAVVAAVIALVGVAASTVVGIQGEALDWEVPLAGAALVAVLMGAAFGAGLERYVWRPLRNRNVALIQMFIVSIGISLMLRHILLVAFGGTRQRYDEFQLQEMWRLGPIAITPRDLSIVGLSVLVLVLVACMLQFTRIGKAMRAVADNRDLAESSGIDVNRVTLYVWSLGGGLSALGGVFYGLNQTVYWQMGFHLLLLMFAAVTLGGLGTAYGAMVGGLVIGLVAQLSTLWFPSQLMNAWALAIMIVVLLVRPQGILGRRERVG
ncbi:branched-chain amino acid ABC transporter permease [Marinitenerispora sediminis]|uniref:Branched-chain amino acid ABC transporter permease n=1 Tax=Marinitenerispora sediminis TaxID=1931232 RepID=A0A368TD70_9ACTN|nr:branched-chain amino acid ABC transporter permease [Marinitenerispora sediminis]RCV59474.1 branched-chain amino acid ABC transporter permease [Marinitenerispora sediminis]RCV61711.1 branched-chain amino acid ABC transporter permease [Marinitenerispora sediminis]